METMQQEERRGLICHLVEEMRNAGSWVGETHIQKCVYFLQNMMDIPAGYRFVLYKHGPYSFDLQGELAVMTARLRLDWELRNNYGPSFILGPWGEKQASKRATKYDDGVKFVAQEISVKDVRSLERISTAFLIRTRKPGVETMLIAEQLHEIKPHISIEDAHQAVDDVVEIQKKAEMVLA